MKPEAQRIAIAEWCGLLDDKAICDEMNQPERLPDYLNDLNAMHEAEERLLTGNGWKERLSRYSSKLMSAMYDTDLGRSAVVFKDDMVHLRYFTLHATAPQRAEALLKTIDRWRDSK